MPLKKRIIFSFVKPSPNTARAALNDCKFRPGQNEGTENSSKAMSIKTEKIIIGKC